MVSSYVTIQSFNWHRAAVPLLIQWSSSMCDVSSMVITKLEEWPVVAKTPRLSLVLYTGQWYTDAIIKFSFIPGFSHITGITSNITLGLDSSTSFVCLFHRAPSKNRP